MDDLDIAELTAALRAGLAGGGAHEEIVWSDRGAELLVRCAHATVEPCSGGVAVSVPVACDEEPSLELRIVLLAPTRTAASDWVAAAHTLTPGPVAARWGPLLEQVVAEAIFVDGQPAATARAAEAPVPAAAETGP